MKTEIEVKFLDINIDSLRNQLTSLGARLVTPERLMRRRNLDFPDLRLAKEYSGWVRVRDEGGKVTMSYKQTNDYSVRGTEEINLDVNNFDAASEFLTTIGLKQKSYQETKRESWELEGVQVEIDTWPWIPPFVELEGSSESDLKRVATKLELNWDSHRAGDVSATYMHYYDIEISKILSTDITFGPVPQWLGHKRKRLTA
ncbi:MAG TPA: class IV adenylate cyclase [Candidatus Saccharimonadia bacterium]|nr:class IV adenylate cyclase [Candidatus Saccharimonadia bacterium]